MKSSLFLSTILSSVAALSPNGAVQIKVGLDFPFVNGSSVASLIDQINTVFLRLDQLNNQNASLIAPNVQLVGIWSNPKLEVSAAISGAFALINQNITALVGSGYSSYTTLSAYISNVGLNGPIPHCDGSSSSPALSSKSKYPTFFRTIPSDAATGTAMAGFVISQGWNYVATAYSDDSYGSGLNTAFVTAARAAGITILTQQVGVYTPEGFSETVANNIALNIQSSDARIIMYFGYDTDLLPLIAAAKKVGVYGPGYAWISDDALSIISGDPKNFAGLLYFFPKERDDNANTASFESYKAANVTSNAIKARYAASYPGDSSWEFVTRTPTDYDWFTASCVDALVMYMDSAVKSWVSQGRTIDSAVQQLATGMYQSHRILPKSNRHLLLRELV